MQVSPKMNVHITLGKEDGLQFLTDMDMRISSNPQIVQAMIQQSQFNEPNTDDIVLIFHYYIENGKQKQARQYFQEALHEDRDQQKMSPIQMPLRNPKNKGTVEITESPGLIIVKYKFLSYEVIGEQEGQLNQNFSKFQKATFDFHASLKGQIRHNNKNRTNIKVDFADLKFFSNEMSPSDFSKFLKLMKIEEQDLDFMFQVPALNMIGNLKRAQFQMKLASFRELRSYYNKACGQKIQKQDKPFPYTNQGLFRKQVSCFGLYRNKVAFKADAIYNGQDVLMRLIKVYTVFLMRL